MATAKIKLYQLPWRWVDSRGSVHFCSNTTRIRTMTLDGFHPALPVLDHLSERCCSVTIDKNVFLWVKVVGFFLVSFEVVCAESVDFCLAVTMLPLLWCGRGIRRKNILPLSWSKILKWHSLRESRPCLNAPQRLSFNSFTCTCRLRRRLCLF